VNDSDLPKCLRRLHEVLTVLLAKMTCRRSLLLNHFNEIYPRSDCSACDICCLEGDVLKDKDSTQNTKKVLAILNEMRRVGPGYNWTEAKLAKAICGYQHGGRKGSKCSNDVSLLKNFGCQLSLKTKDGRTQASEEQVMRFILHLISEDILQEIRKPGFFTICKDYNSRYPQREQFYIQPGPKAHLVLEG